MKYYSAGFEVVAEVSGSKYPAPLSPASVLSFTNGVVILNGGGLPTGVTNRIVLGPSSKVTNLSSNKLTLTITTSSGAFKGGVVNPATGISLPVSGAVLQKLNAGYGFFLGTNQSGQVYFGP